MRINHIFIIFAFWIGPLRADQIQYLALPQQSLSAMVNILSHAKHTIEIATFIYEPCHPSARVLTDILMSKAKEGVHVRVLLDALTQPMAQSQNIAAEFENAGIELREYSTGLTDLNMRMHSKMMIVDGQTYIVGGRNLSDEYFDLSSRLNYVDRDIRVAGTSARNAEAAFNRLWNSDMVSTYVWPGDFQDWREFCEVDPAARISVVKKYLKRNADDIVNSVPVRTCNIKFVVDDPDFFKAQYGPDWNQTDKRSGFMTKARLKRKHSTQAVLGFLAGTNQDLILENENYLAITNLQHAFAHLRARHIPMQLIVNQDVDDGPQFFLHAEEYEVAKIQKRDSVGSEKVALVASTGSLNTAFELTPRGVPFFMHGKVAVRDHRDILIGSFNMDSRSANINVETAATITDCPDLAGDVSGHFNQVYQQFEKDSHSPHPPGKPDPNPFEKMLGDLLLPEL